MKEKEYIMQYAGSYHQNIPEIMDIIKRLGPDSVLDIGCGSGKYGEEIKKVIPDCVIYGVDGFDGYRNPMWDNYKNIRIKNVKEMKKEDFIRNWSEYDYCVNSMCDCHAPYYLYLLVDILEHLSKEDAMELISKIPENANVIISIPWDYDQHDEVNPLQNHISKWTFDDFPDHEKWQNFSNERSMMLLRSNWLKIEDFSVAIIAKNEEKTIGRLLQSIKGVRDIVVYDTGSVDTTVKIAKEFGCKVKETIIDDKIFDDFNGKKIFNFAKARNMAMSYTKNDFCFNPDCDEVCKWDVQEIRRLLPGSDMLKYTFCFAHGQNGSPSLEFTHTKFFRKSVYKWDKPVHEIPIPLEGKEGKSVYTKALYLEHWQNKDTDRSQYLTNLEYAVTIDPDPRNVYYLGREYYYLHRWQDAIDKFEKFFTLKSYPAEISQAYIEMGVCYSGLKNEDKMLECYFKAMKADNKRREPFYYVANYYMNKKDFSSAILYFVAALEIPFKSDYYLNDMNLYTWKIHNDLAQCFYYTGQMDRAREQFLKASSHLPDPEYIREQSKFYFPGGNK